MIRRLLHGLALATFLLGGVGAMSASADDPPPIQPPPGVTGTTNPGTSTPGPTYVITPGVGGSDLGAPGDRKALEDAQKADKPQAEKTAGAKPDAKAGTPNSGAGRTGTAVTGPQTPLDASTTGTDSVGLLWRGLAAVVMMLVLFEITEVKRFLVRRRRPAVTAG